MALDPLVHHQVTKYLVDADRLLPNRIVGFYVVGSAALGAFQPGRSDIDFIAVVDGGFGPGELRRLRLLQAISGWRTSSCAVIRRMTPLSGTCNGVFVPENELERPVTQISAVASQSGERFRRGKAFDVNPVVWKVFSERAITIRGPAPQSLKLDPEADLLGAWNRENLKGHWRSWALTIQRRPDALFRLRPRFLTARGVLGAPHLHRTITTGEVVSKQEAGAYALQTFDTKWHQLIREALAFWDRRPFNPGLGGVAERARQTAAFVLMVVDSISSHPTTDHVRSMTSHPTR